MEKVCAAWWRDPADAAPELATGPGAQLAKQLTSRLTELLSADVVRAATLHVEASEHESLRHGRAADGRLLTALASVWVDSYQDLPALPGEPVAWLVTESIPQPYGDAFNWPEGRRSPGLTLVTLLDKPAEVEEAEFYSCWHGLHRATTAECHPFASYVRNEVVRPLTAGAPSCRGLVTESALDLADFLDPHRFYVSGGDPDKLRTNQRRVFGEIVRFIDMDTIQVAPMAEFVLRRLAPTSP